ncbi:MAG TPA: hypothetical protein VN837_18855 [Chloroflexota bacterium]|nr:hypothetical protein [Chloroflexota bacterium]
MARTMTIRKTLGALVLGLGLALPGQQLAQTMAPQVTHAAASNQTGPVLGGDWSNQDPTARFSEFQIDPVYVGVVNGGLPTAIIYPVNVFDVRANRFVAFGESAPVPYTAAGTAVVKLASLTSSVSRLTTPVQRLRAVSTTITMIFLPNVIIDGRPAMRVLIHDHSLLFGDRYSSEIMHQ